MSNKIKGIIIAVTLSIGSIAIFQNLITIEKLIENLNIYFSSSQNNSDEPISTHTEPIKESTSLSTLAPQIVVTQEPQDCSQSTPSYKVIEKTIIKKEIIERVAKVLTPTESGISNEVEDSKSSDSEEVNSNENDDSKISKGKYEFSIESPGQIVLLSDDKNSQDGFFDI